LAQLTSATDQDRLVQGRTVFNDGGVDTLRGQTGSDVFYIGSADTITDLGSSDRAFIAVGS
jgi:hypothetical protein